jgi:hypothetical protein
MRVLLDPLRAGRSRLARALVAFVAAHIECLGRMSAPSQEALVQSGAD